MSATLVLDASVTLAWCFSDQRSKVSELVQSRLAIETAVVPTLWHLEVANVLVLAERRKRIVPSAADRFLSLLGAFNIETDHSGAARAFGRTLDLCRKHSLTAYDAAYLELAERRQLPIATLDVDMRRAAKAAGVGVVG